MPVVTIGRRDPGTTSDQPTTSEPSDANRGRCGR